jgi:hypothetical protein
MPKHPRIPASPAVVKRIIPEILESEGPLKRDEIIAKLQQVLPLRGFTYSGNASVITTKKALSDLVSLGKITSPRIAWYELSENSSAAPTTPATGDEEEAAVVAEVPANKPDTPKLRIEREIGEGPECVYVYFHDVYFELAQRKGNSTWECKVGSTVGTPDARIIGQGALTCFPRCPVIGLVIRTHDGRNLERLLHAALSYAGVKVKNDAGSEWFLTSPSLLEKWFLQFKESVRVLSSE